MDVRRLLRNPHLPAVLALALLLAWWLRVLFSHYYGYLYAFTDLGIINDWFTNAWYAGRPFWITELDNNHLRVHFTPSVILIAPFYLFTESQFVLVALGAVAMAAGLWIAHLLWMHLVAGRHLGEAAAGAWSVVLMACFAMNPYVREVLDSAHIEVFAIPLAMGFFYLRLREARPMLSAVLLALCLGVREEAGIFLGAQCLALLALPAAKEKSGRWRRGMIVSALCCFAYVLLVVKVVNPLVLGVVGDYHVQRGWDQWGDTWFEVAFTMATSPLRLFAALRDSAFFSLNLSFGLLPWLAPVAAALVNLPAMLLYGGSEPYQKYLWYYNASFVLPGMLLTACAGGARLAAWLAGLRGRSRAWAHAAVAAVWLAAAAALGLLYRYRDRTPESTFAYLPAFAAQADAAVVRRWAMACGPQPRLATDTRRIVFAPLRGQRFLLRHADRADLALVFRGADPSWSGAETSEELWDSLQGHPDFALREETAAYRVYVRRGAHCGAG